MDKLGTLLIVDDALDVLLAAELLLKHHCKHVLTTDSPGDIESILSNQTVDVVLLDMNFDSDAISGQEGFYWLQKILSQSPDTAVLMMTAYADIALAVDAIKRGATDFVSKPWDNDRLIASVASAFQHSQEKQKVGQLTRQANGLSHVLQNEFPAFLGKSAVMQEVFSTINKAAQTDANILITGESGTGKELAARAIHQQSHRVGKPMISMDMGSIPENLFESELFGHKERSFY